MNRVILMGRLTRDPEIRYSNSGDQMAVARYTIAVDRPGGKNQDEPSADFIGCVCFGKSAEFVEKYLKKGTKIAVEGRIRTGRYQNKDGQTVYTTDVVVDRHEFCESKGNGQAPQGNYQQPQNQQAQPQQQSQAQPQQTASQPAQGYDPGFMNIPDGIDEELPFG